ncbi:MAG: phosphatidate cytidylyltransferase [Clostridia bacterium]|nr:phosphatidate cytidylyltransferase [Clostridia bacterium]
MLKTRVISAVVGAVLLIVLLSLGNIALGLGILVLSLIGIRELYQAVSHAGYKPVRWIGYLACIPIFLISLSGENKVSAYVGLLKSVNSIFFGIFVMLMVLFSLIVFLHDKYSLIDIALTVFGILYVPFLFSFIVLTRGMTNGVLFIWIIFIAWSTDTFAYFTGLMLGKHKLLPAISPKKTIEGSIGGIIGCVAATIAYGIFIRAYIGEIPIYHFVIIGLLNGIISQVGDLSASAIKRFVNIKDYGKVMPGHGGVLDRFDSILFVAPVVYFYLSFIVLK